MAMTNEEIDAEIARLTALKQQNDKEQQGMTTQQADSFSGGIKNPADYIGQITSKMNEAGYTDEQGNKKSYGRGDKFSSNLDVAKNAGRRTGFEKDRDGTPLPETAYEWIEQQLNARRAKGPMSKEALRAIENGAKVRYNLPSKFDISGMGLGNTDRKMAKAMNSMPYNGNTQSAQPAQTPQKPAEQKPAEQKPSTNDALTEAYKKIKNKQASDADLDLFKDYSEEQLKKMGFGPISIKAIKGRNRQTEQIDENTVRGTKEQMQADIANGNVKPTYNENSIIGATQEELDAMKAQGLSDDLYNKGVQALKNGNGLSDDDVQFMNQYKQYTQQLSGAQPRDAAGVQAMQNSEPHKFVTDPANKERYQKLLQIQKGTKKVNKQNKATERRDTAGSGQAIPGNMR